MYIWALVETVRPIFFQPSSRIRVGLLLYDSKPTEERGKNDWMAVKKLTGVQSLALKKEKASPAKEGESLAFF